MEPPQLLGLFRDRPDEQRPEWLVAGIYGPPSQFDAATQVRTVDHGQGHSVTIAASRSSSAA